MTIQRQYSLPNCTLLLEGLSETTSNTLSDVRPVMSILVNVECHLAGGKPNLTGGRDFFESLVRAVSRYAQEFLSGVHYPPEERDSGIPLVQIQRRDGNLHRLIVQNQSLAGIQPNGITASSTSRTPVVVDLTTVQLFDLVEAIDQFLADSQTLPDLSLNLMPLSRQYAIAEQPLPQRAAPLALGVSSLALAAIAFFLVPIPEVQKPKDPQPQPNSNSLTPTPTASEPVNTNTVTPSPLATPSETTPSPLSATDTPLPSPLATPSETTPSPLSATDTPLPSPLVSTSESPTPLATANSTPPGVTTTEITDPTQLFNLNQQLYNQVNQAWESRANNSQELVYRVSVDQDGKVVGYKPINPAAGNAANQTPLPKLLQNPAAVPEVTQKSIADFRVVFSSRGVLQVSPWKGYSIQPTSQPTNPSDPNLKSSSQVEIRDAATLRSLNQKLYQQIRENREGKLRFPRPLEFRVAVRSDGTISEYEPLNSPATNYVNQTPLPKLKTTSNSTDPATASQEPVAYYKVVFTPGGVLQVSPWRGYR